MPRRILCTLLAMATALGSLLLLMAESAAAPPKELYGKSIVVSWFESRSQTERKGALQNPTISIYVSTAGRVFTRVFVALGKGRGGFARPGHRPTTTAEQGPGDTQLSGARVTRTEFAAHSLIMTSQFDSGARRIVVDLEGGLTSCQAKVMHGKEIGQGTMRQTSMFGGTSVEVRAIDVSGVTCRIQDGNALTAS